MRVLVTGGAGYVGSVVVDHLLREHEVIVLDQMLRGNPYAITLRDNSQLMIARGSVCDAQLVQALADSCDAIVHLAARVGVAACKGDPALARSTNETGTINVCKSAAQACTRLIYLSTCSILGESNIYTETKKAGEIHVLDYGGVVLRLGTVYGLSANMRFDLLVNQMTRDAVVHEQVGIWGAENWRPYVHIATVGNVVLDVLALGADCDVYRIVDFNMPKGVLAAIITGRVGGKVVIDGERKDSRDYRATRYFPVERSAHSMPPLVQLGHEVSRIAQLVRCGTWDQEGLFGERSKTHGG